MLLYAYDVQDEFVTDLYVSQCVNVIICIWCSGWVCDTSIDVPVYTFSGWVSDIMHPYVLCCYICICMDFRMSLWRNYVLTTLVEMLSHLKTYSYSSCHLCSRASCLLMTISISLAPAATASLISSSLVDSEYWPLGNPVATAATGICSALYLKQNMSDPELLLVSMLQPTSIKWIYICVRLTFLGAPHTPWLC